MIIEYNYNYNPFPFCFFFCFEFLHSHLQPSRAFHFQTLEYQTLYSIYICSHCNIILFAFSSNFYKVETIGTTVVIDESNDNIEWGITQYCYLPNKTSICNHISKSLVTLLTILLHSCVTEAVLPLFFKKIFRKASSPYRFCD